MLYFWKTLPKNAINTDNWKPFIKNQWFRNHFMYFVYCLQITLFICSIIFGIWHFSNVFIKLCLFIGTYLIHELLHISVICKRGDISITHSGIFLWITSGAVLNKLRFFIFMSLPFFTLSVIPTVLSIVLSGELKNYIVYIAWINAIIAAADMINSVLIIIKPNNSFFYRSYYKTNSNFEK